jgi:uncharacterized protein (TIGR03382 family)
MSAAIGALALLPEANAHIFNYSFGLTGGAVVPPNQSEARGRGTLYYNHHTFKYDFDVFISGITLDELLDVGPNGTPLQIFHGKRGQNGDRVLDPAFYGDFVQEAEGIRLTVEVLPLGGQQGNLFSNIFENDQWLAAGELYVQVFTTDYPNGELRGQIPPIFKFKGLEDSSEGVDLSEPPGKIPAPSSLALAAMAGLVISRRRR